MAFAENRIRSQYRSNIEGQTSKKLGIWIQIYVKITGTVVSDYKMDVLSVPFNNSTISHNILNNFTRFNLRDPSSYKNTH